MDATRRGKVARLPQAVREELNRRLADGQAAGQVLPWLNKLARVRKVLAADFGGTPVSKQNLHQWRLGGYQDWLRQQATLDAVERLSEEGQELLDGPGAGLTGRLGAWLAARYAVATRSLTAKNGQMDWKRLRQLCKDLVALRHSEHGAMRLLIAQERLDLKREKSEEEIEEHFLRWSEQPEVKEWFAQQHVDPEEKQRRIRAILGFEDAEPGEETGQAQGDEHA